MSRADCADFGRRGAEIVDLVDDIAKILEPSRVSDRRGPRIQQPAARAGWAAGVPRPLRRCRRDRGMRRLARASGRTVRAARRHFAAAAARASRRTGGGPRLRRHAAGPAPSLVVAAGRWPQGRRGRARFGRALRAVSASTLRIASSSARRSLVMSDSESAGSIERNCATKAARARSYSARRASPVLVAEPVYGAGDERVIVGHF